MKNKTLTLTRILLRNGDGFGIKQSNTGVSKFLYLFFFVVLVPVLLFTVTRFQISAYNTLALIGQEGVIVSWALSLVSIFIFFFGIFYIVSSFYFSTDIEGLLHLPLKPLQIIGAKFAVITLYEYGIAFVILAPTLIVYGIKSSQSVLFYLYSAISFILAPIIPLAIGSIIVMVIMRFTNLSRYKDLLKIVGGMVAIFIGLFVNIMTTRILEGTSTGQLEQLLLQGENSLVKITSAVFPSTKWATDALLSSNALNGFLNLLIFVAVSIGAFLLLLYLAELLYFKGVIGLSESSGSGQTKIVDLEREIVKGSVIKTYTLVELKLLFRTPIYFLNCVLINFIFPLLLLLPMLTAGGSEDFSELIAAIQGVENKGMVVAVIFAILIFLGGVNGVTPSTISREGEGLFVKKYLPVSYKDQITAKVLSGLIIGYIGLITTLIAAFIFIKISLSLVVIILLTGWLPILFTSFTGILIDLNNPKLNWVSEQQAVKQNMNVLYNIIIGMIFAVLTVVATLHFKWGFATALVMIIAIYALLNILTGSLVYTKGAKVFAELEG